MLSIIVSTKCIKQFCDASSLKLNRFIFHSMNFVSFGKNFEFSVTNLNFCRISSNFFVSENNSFFVS